MWNNLTTFALQLSTDYKILYFINILFIIYERQQSYAACCR